MIRPDWPRQKALSGLRRLSRVVRRLRASPSQAPSAILEAKARTAAAPLDETAHLALARGYAAARRWWHALAEYRCAETLGATAEPAFVEMARAYARIGQVELARRVLDTVPRKVQSPLLAEVRNELASAKQVPLSMMDHNQHYRHRSLADYVSRLGLRSDFSLLDVGGGVGQLGVFLPSTKYFVVEPVLNGLDGTRLPFGAGSFDVVIACHVLEHIPPKDRETFLDNLCRVARNHVVLLNPFQHAKLPERERLELVLSLTGQAWAKEHLECTLPRLEDVCNYADQKGFRCHTEPNGTLSVTLAMVFGAHYALHAKQSEAFERVNQYFNEKLHPFLANTDAPTGWIVHFELNRSAA